MIPSGPFQADPFYNSVKEGKKSWREEGGRLAVIDKDKDLLAKVLEEYEPTSRSMRSPKHK